MRKIFTFLCALFLAVQFSAAQHNLYVIDKDGKLAAYSADTVSFSDDVFSFTNGLATNVTNYSFRASFQVMLKSDEIKSFAQTLEVGVCYSETNENITIQSGKRISGTSLGNYSITLFALISGTTYYWRPYVKVGNAVYYGEISEQTTLGEKPSDNKSINGHKYIDLGLPSGLLWAETNIGAAIAADDGNYYAWGETTTKSDYSEDTYKYYNSATNTYAKYGYTPRFKHYILDNEDDAAYMNRGSSCRMPTDAEFEELHNFDNCTWNWTSQANSSGNSVKGYRVTSKKNGNSIFLPASDYVNTANPYIQGPFGYYWSRTLHKSYDFSSASASAFFFNSDYIYVEYRNRCLGFTVRPVAEPSENQKGQAIQPTGNTQQNMRVVNSSGKANFMDVSSVDFATFHADGSWFCITDDGIDDKTTSSISASCTVALATGGKVKSLDVTPEVGVCYSITNSLPTINDECQTLGSSLKSYSFTLSSLISGTIYYYRVYIKLNDEVFYGDAVEVQVLGIKPDNSKYINGHKFVDLWLPSGLLWAETNIGAKTAADDGNYYAWGETSTKSNYDWYTYKYSDYHTKDGLTKYNSTDGKTVLDLEDDAARMDWVGWRGSCRMPTKAEFEELLNSDNCKWTWTSMNDSSGNSVEGYRVTGRNGSYIFLPASGSRTDYLHPASGYWSSTLDTSVFGNAYYLNIYSSGSRMNIGSRCVGIPVRPVAEP